MKSSMDEYLTSLRQRGRCEGTIRSHGVWVRRFLTGRTLGLISQFAVSHTPAPPARSKITDGLAVNVATHART
jgi:hypothetical protein